MSQETETARSYPRGLGVTEDDFYEISRDFRLFVVKKLPGSATVSLVKRIEFILTDSKVYKWKDVL